MRRGPAWMLWAVVLVPALARAQSADVTAEAEPASAPAAPPQTIIYGALPGGLHALSAETLAPGVVEVSTLTGVGHGSGLLGSTHKFIRAVGDLAAGYGITDMISVGLSLDGRYDKHWGLPPQGDDNLVGDPHLNARIAKGFGAMRLGLQVGVWLPGGNAPSIVFGATSLDVHAVASFALGPATLSLDGGYRLDNSRASEGSSKIMTYSAQDRASLGVSDFNAVLAGAQLAYPAGKAFVSVEGSLEAYIGSPATGDGALSDGKLLFRGGLAAGMHFNDQWSALLFVEAAKDPGVTSAQVASRAIPLVPYEPTFTGGLGIEARFGGPHRAAMIVEKDCHRHNPPDCPAVKVPITAEITGTVVDQLDKPLVGAKVTVTLKNSQVPPVTTDDKGAYTLKAVPIGMSIDNKQNIEETGIEVNVTLDGQNPGKATIAAVQPGANTVAPIKLKPILPPGELRGNVRALPAGKPVAGATITVTPGDLKAESGADGVFDIELAPGQYKMTVKAPGLAPQELDIVIDPHSVNIKNIDLHK